MIRALHLFSNHKLTGPAELALDTALAVEKSGNDMECRFLPAQHPADPFWIGDLARKRKARLVEVEGLRLQKHFNPIRAWFDSRRLAGYLRENPADIIHCHLPNDHLVAGFAMRRLSKEFRAPIIRTIYDGNPIPMDWRAKRTLGRNCSMAICFSRKVHDQLRNGVISLPEEMIRKVDPPIDTDRFHPPDPDQKKSYRAALGIPDDSFVAGIVARMQPHRRFGPLLEAVRIAKDRIPGFRFLIIGRGTHQDKVAREPVRKLGLENTVLFTGYRTGDDYLPALHAMDVKVYLMPGSDGTCRAVREALSSGIPVIAANRGMLAELVEDGITGSVIDDTPGNIADNLVDLSKRGERIRTLSRNARKSALERFSYGKYASLIREICHATLERSP